MTEFWVCGRCRSLNRGRSTRCYSCRAPYAPDEPGGGQASAPIPGAGPASGSFATGPAIGGGATSTASPLAAPGAAFAAGRSSASSAAASTTGGRIGAAEADPGAGLIGGVIGGAIGAIASAGLWYAVVTTTHIEAGVVAVAVGFIVAEAVLFGAGRASLALVPVAVVATLLALAAAQYLITVATINDIVLARGDGTPTLPILASPPDVLRLVVAWFEFDPLTLLFWGIALLQAVAIPWQRARTGGRSWRPGPGRPSTPIAAGPGSAS